MQVTYFSFSSTRSDQKTLWLGKIEHELKSCIKLEKLGINLREHDNNDSEVGSAPPTDPPNFFSQIPSTPQGVNIC